MRRSDRNTKNMQKRDDKNLMYEGTFEDEVKDVLEVVSQFTRQENIVKIQCEKNDGKVENKEVVNV